MNKNHVCWELLEKEYKNFPEDCAGSVSDKAINTTQELFKTSFSESYAYFLKAYGSGLFDGYIIYGIVPMSSMGSFCTNIVDKTFFYKVTQGWPDIEDWIVISDDGSGNPIGLLPNGEVWLSDHDSNFEKIRLAKSFEDFLYKLLTNTLYEDDD